MEVYLNIKFFLETREKRYRIDEYSNCKDFEILREETKNITNEHPVLKVMLKVMLIKCKNEYFIFGNKKEERPWGIQISEDRANHLLDCEKNSFINCYESFPY